MYKSLTWGIGVVCIDQVLHVHVFRKLYAVVASKFSPSLKMDDE